MDELVIVSHSQGTVIAVDGLNSDQLFKKGNNQEQDTPNIGKVQTLTIMSKNL